MTEEDIAVKLNGHEHEISSLKHRTKRLEKQNKVIQDLVLSVKELAINMRNMMEEQKKQGERLLILEKKPAEQWSTLTKTIFTTIISTTVGGVVGALIASLI
ncbi:hypothetical protein KQI61_06645 [Anaerocolumna aminovalerica]|uniref:hypothetical protein n=1 Tax=Anaerocolumna aminovalerica TaxID=1527 RepID=UPI001C0F2D4C|nr:hypothetical protein [Anaerocolumna aminovalerica]MBU5331871.1 hypothetical protein [Anaerocolumna aminovalerica]